jgi:hypothetical protein
MLRFRNPARSRAILWWAVILFAAVQVGIAGFITRIRPEVRDPEYGSLFNTLRARLAEAPGRPLVLILGSSRSANAIRPSPPGPGPLVFNFATVSTGPVRQLQMLRRLLGRGVRPAWVVAEFWAPFLTQRSGFFLEEVYIGDQDVQPPDLPLVARYFAHPGRAYSKLAQGVLVPAFSHRGRLLQHYAPFPKLPAQRQPGDWADPELRKAEGFGWLPAPEPRPEPEKFRRNTAFNAEYTRKGLAAFQVSPVADRALHELLETCTRHGIRLALVLFPEHSSMRACYPPETEARVRAYLADLCRDQVPVIDTRDWVGDDDFIDMVHAVPQAAAPYTERWGREVLSPLLRGEPLAPNLLLGGPPVSPEQPPPVH